ncbi:MAG: amine oxidase [Magnetovibrio sp.]|nr:amine oxidase [Magnetovibrio sp.]|tara:strand:- start:1427 stop:2683 length:1257 start_codon:yes stop_codon:yes gene_type:complete
MDCFNFWNNSAVEVHIIGAGLSGLACAVHLTKKNLPITIYEATDHAGGRCRSFFDNVLERKIDNGNHLILSGNHQAKAYMQAINSLDSMFQLTQARFPFLDLKNGDRWSVNTSRRFQLPDSSVLDLPSIIKLAWASESSTVAEIMNTSRPLYKKLWEPLCVSILNTAPEDASASLLWSVLRQTFGRGAKACRPCIAKNGLSESLIDPALKLLEQKGVFILFNKRLKSLCLRDGRAIALTFGRDKIYLGPNDIVILALPISATGELLPGMRFPDQHNSIVNAHFILPRKYKSHNFLGLIGGVSQWLFVRQDIASVTVSAADKLIKKTNKKVAHILWPEVLRALDLKKETLPPYRIIKEKHATIAQTPEQIRLRPNAQTEWSNLLLAGDWTNTGLPATIEGAITSGHRAAEVICRQQEQI